MTQKLKTTIMLKDKDFLQELIDSPNVMKRKLMSKLVLERQDQISSELTRLRMRPVQSNSGGFGDSPGTDDAAGIIEELENDSK